MDLSAKVFQYLTKKWCLQIRLDQLLHKGEKETLNPQVRVFWGKPSLHGFRLLCSSVQPLDLFVSGSV